MNPYEPPKSSMGESITKNGKVDELEDRIRRFEGSSWGVGLRLYTKIVWSAIFVNSIIAIAIILTVSECSMVIPVSAAECMINNVNVGGYVTYSFMFMIPIVVGLVFVNWLARQVLMFIFALKY